MARPSNPAALRCRCNRSERVKAMQIKILGIDLGKNLCSLAGLDGSGQVVVRRRVRRENVLKVVSHLKPSVVAMEACGGAHHLGRLLRDAGFEVRLMSPEYVRPYVKAQKNDDRDAEAIDLPPKKWTGLGRHTLSETWTDIAQGRMQAAGIVEPLDILEEVSSGLGAGAVNPMVNPLGLEAVKEAFHWRVVQTIAFTAHRGCYA